MEESELSDIIGFYMRNPHVSQHYVADGCPVVMDEDGDLFALDEDILDRLPEDQFFFKPNIPQGLRELTKRFLRGYREVNYLRESLTKH